MVGDTEAVGIDGPRKGDAASRRHEAAIADMEILDIVHTAVAVQY